MANLAKAIEIAFKAHAGQRDKGGNLYIGHSLRVMQSMLDCSDEEAHLIGRDNLMMVAVLHDVVEDTKVSILDLKMERFPLGVTDAVSVLTRGGTEKYMAYIKRVCANRVAMLVKLADLRDNMDLSRIKHVTEKDMARIAKYAVARKFILNELGRL